MSIVFWARATLIALATLAVVGCASMDRSIAIAEQVVTPVVVGQATDVPAYDLAEAMLRAGFTPDQIIKDGPAIRNALATAGGAQVRYGHVAEAIFAVHGQELLITSRTRGSFTHPLVLIVDTPRS